jgi:hypothetical protein
MKTALLYPRLPRSAARKLITDRGGITVNQLVHLAELGHPDAEPSATGGHPVDRSKIQEVQSTIRAVAEAAGFPAPLGRNVAQNFDRPCGTALFDTMQIVPADAAEEGVWSFLTIVVVPEIGPWRFPTLAEERLLGHPRNVLRRTWWRAWAFGPDLLSAPEGCEPLGEDESVGIMERPSLGGNPRTAHALQAALWRAEQKGLSVPRSELMRQLARRARAAKSHIQLDALTDRQLNSLLDRVVHESLLALSH